jgi:hypothetical protein
MLDHAIVIFSETQLVQGVDERAFGRDQEGADVKPSGFARRVGGIHGHDLAICSAYGKFPALTA